MFKSEKELSKKFEVMAILVINSLIYAESNDYIVIINENEGGDVFS